MKVVVPVYPTEDSDKLIEAVLSIAPDAELDEKGDKLIVQFSDGSRLLKKIMDKRVATTALNWIERRGYLMLNKQALVHGKLNILYVEQPLGNMKVYVDSKFKSLLSAATASSP